MQSLQRRLSNLNLPLLQPHKRLSSNAQSLDGRGLLASLERLFSELRNTTKIGEKLAIVRQYPLLFPFLQFYLSCGPFHITSKAIQKGEEEEGMSQTFISGDSPPPQDMRELLEALGGRKLTGNAAKHALSSFIRMHPEYESLVKALIDRDLRIGMGTTLLKRAIDESEPRESVVIRVVDAAPADARHINLQDLRGKPQKRSSFPVTSQDLPVALGFPLQHRSVKLNATPGEYWLISRKLDGIRCLAHFKGGELLMCTRAGKTLGHLPEIQKDLSTLAQQIRVDNPELDDFYIDGELCVLNEKPDNGGACETMIDDFREALSIVLSRPTEASLEQHARRKRLFFYAFDLIQPQHMRGESLFARLEKLKASLQSLQSTPLQFVKLLHQHRTEDPFEFRRFLDAARMKRWEGLVLRRDAPFKPKRTRDIIKIKDFFEAEFKVLDYRLERMSIAVKGKHVMEELLSSVMVDFAGTRVWVGSGFTVEERRKYAQNPELLLGSEVTVRYFQETSSQGREEKLKSLRFPTIKAIYDGPRPM